MRSVGVEGDKVSGRAWVGGRNWDSSRSIRENVLHTLSRNIPMGVLDIVDGFVTVVTLGQYSTSLALAYALRPSRRREEGALHG